MTDMREEELEKIKNLLTRGSDIDRLPAFLMAAVTSCDSLEEIENLYKCVRPFIIKTYNQLDKEENVAFSIRLLLGIVDTISTAGYMSKRVSSEQNRKAQNKRHEPLKEELTPIVGQALLSMYDKDSEIIPNNKQVIDRVLEMFPEYGKHQEFLKNHLAKIREEYGVPPARRGPPKKR